MRISRNYQRTKHDYFVILCCLPDVHHAMLLVSHLNEHNNQHNWTGPSYWTVFVSGRQARPAACRSIEKLALTVGIYQEIWGVQARAHWNQTKYSRHWRDVRAGFHFRSCRLQTAPAGSPPLPQTCNLVRRSAARYGRERPIFLIRYYGSSLFIEDSVINPTTW